MKNTKSIEFINQNTPKLKIRLFLSCSSVVFGFFFFINSIFATDRYYEVKLTKTALKSTGWLTFEDMLKWTLITICTLFMIKIGISGANKMRSSQGWGAFLSLVGIIFCAFALNIFRKL